MTIDDEQRQQQAYERAKVKVGVPPGVEAPLSVVDVLIGRTEAPLVQPPSPSATLAEELANR